VVFFLAKNGGTQGEWDQGKFEELLLEWIIACDQPFDEVEKPEFKKLMEYTSHRAQPLKLPGRNGIKRRVVDLGEDGINETKIMFAVRTRPFTEAIPSNHAT